MALTSEEVNYLVYRYLVESGFSHASFTFGHECSIDDTNINPDDVPPGALITFIQKGMQFLEVEASLNEGGTDIEGDFALLTTKDLLSKSVPELRATVRRRRKQLGAPMTEDEPMDLGNDRTANINDDAVLKLDGHSAEVYTCAFSPVVREDGEVDLATSGADASARLWEMPSTVAASADVGSATLLKHPRARDVSTIAWSPDGEHLATGAHDGLGRIWSRSGELLHTLESHGGAVLAVRYNHAGDMVATASVDKTVVVWDAATGALRQKFETHTGGVMALDWLSNDTLATAGSDRAIHVVQVGGTGTPRTTFLGHKDDVTELACSPSRTLLASASEDSCARVWRLLPREENGAEGAGSAAAPVVLKGHTRGVQCVAWQPAAALRGRADATDEGLLVATSSMDHGVRVWRASSGECVHALQAHAGAVHSVAWSPDGRWLVSGGMDGKVCVWNVHSGECVRRFEGRAAVHCVAWRRDTAQVAAATVDGPVLVFDVKLDDEPEALDGEMETAS
ncbi:unnamed protein product [Pedinophyceae sp. YPF-701]|nr:unnamed protein product [Pedinophyceae sp. YPF-701]